MLPDHGLVGYYLCWRNRRNIYTFRWRRHGSHQAGYAQCR